jgi:hypothetical protein
MVLVPTTAVRLGWKRAQVQFCERLEEFRKRAHVHFCERKEDFRKILMPGVSDLSNPSAAPD